MQTFGSKAQTLEKLRNILNSAKVMPLSKVTVGEWLENRYGFVQQLKTNGWFEKSLIVRSSALSEDSFSQSLAGHYESILSVKGEKQVIAAIERVMTSFRDAKNEDEVFVQPMLDGIWMSGVAFSRIPSSGAPYILINYDDVSGSTSSVTSGMTNELKSYYCYRESEASHPKGIREIIELIYELENIFGVASLDIEFAITLDNELYLFQVRPLVFQEDIALDFAALGHSLENIEKKIRLSDQKIPYLHGSRAVFGIMPDWNPAEIIGIRPRPLALSLYKEIITDQIWAYQRDNYGYRNLRSFPLLVTFAGQPYIDVRVSFNSFIPGDLDADLAERLTDYYLDRLINSPSFHDKVEFEIIFSCYSLDLPERLHSLKRYGFSQDDCDLLSSSLLRLTNRIIDEKSGLWCHDREKVDLLPERCSKILHSSRDLISKIYWLLEDCKRYGTLPFAGLARAAFIAIQMLKSLVHVNILTHEEYNLFLESLDTVSSCMSRDFNDLDKHIFLEKYGHLRPGTYDILSSTYKEAPDKYFDWSKEHKNGEKKLRGFALSLDQMKKIENLLKIHGFNHDIISFFEFIKLAIEGREYSKFLFTKSLSCALELIEKMGNELGINREECSFVDISIIKDLYASSKDSSSLFKESIAKGKKEYALTQQVILPPLITKPEDVWAFHLPQAEPNFITLKSSEGDVACAESSQERLLGGIFFIPSADPGYDWIFSHGIAGFVTKYGGVNSHMAIRAAELGIPAVIGCGEILYEKWSKASRIKIDCGTRQVFILK